MLRLFFLRHGETGWNLERRIQGANSDIPLNDRGRRQALGLASALQGTQISLVLSSPMRRSLDTALAVARPHRVSPIAMPELREIDVGELEGKVVDTLEMSLSQFLVQDKNGDMPRLPGGEGLGDLQARAWPAVRGAIERQDDGNIVIVSHYFTGLVLICSTLGYPLSAIRRLRISPGSVSVIGFAQTGNILMSLNDVCHLDRDDQ
ncbi:MAG: histidine phosphatase family protein [Chloroflexi bacterium]|nr:histidine phosphatase family protein [Chloroflexota bacterium]